MFFQHCVTMIWKAIRKILGHFLVPFDGNNNKRHSINECRKRDGTRSLLLSPTWLGAPKKGFWWSFPFCVALSGVRLVVLAFQQVSQSLPVLSSLKNLVQWSCSFLFPFQINFETLCYIHWETLIYDEYPVLTVVLFNLAGFANLQRYLFLCSLLRRIAHAGQEWLNEF